MARDWRRAVLAAFAAAMLGGACALGASARAADKKRQDPAEAQRVIESALKQVQAGKAERAVQALSDTLEGGNLPPAIMAKAFYVRGVAHRQEGRPAQAISDLNSALWLKGGLGVDDRAEALRERSAAYADAGLRDPAGSPAPRAPKTASGGGSNWLSGLFGSSSPAPEPVSPPRARSPEPARASSAAAAVPGGGWTSNTEVQRSAPAPAARRAKAEPRPARHDPPARKAEGRYLVQLAAVRTEADARALAATAKRKHAALAARGQSIDRAVLGNMGAFYRVRFGPFASAEETETVCARLQASGIDCMPVTR